MQANILSYAHSPLDVSLAPLHFSELWHHMAPKSIKPIVRMDALTDLPPVDAVARPTAPSQPATAFNLAIQPARPRFNEEHVYINREQSLLRFYRRVLEEAQDETQPLLERCKFLSIVGSNLAEFFMVRVAGIKQQIHAGIAELSPDGLTPTQQLVAIRPMALELMNDARECLGQLLPKLDRAGIHLLDYAALDAEQRAGVQERFDEIVFPVLTPMAYDPGRPFPHVSNMSLNLAILLRDPQGHEHFARVKVPNTLPRLMPVKSPLGTTAPEDASPREYYFVWLEQVIAAPCQSLVRRPFTARRGSFRAEVDPPRARKRKIFEGERGWGKTFSRSVRMKLYFLRHGLAGERSEWKGDDAKRPLTEEGKAKIQDVAATIAKWDLDLNLIVTSPYIRSYQTAEIVARKLKRLDRLVKDDRVAYGFDAGKLAKILAEYPKAEALMFVGHEPDFSTTIRRLIGGGRVVVRKGGLACLDLPDPKAMKGELLWLVTPKLMA